MERRHEEELFVEKQIKQVKGVLLLHRHVFRSTSPWPAAWLRESLTSFLLYNYRPSFYLNNILPQPTTPSLDYSILYTLPTSKRRPTTTTTSGSSLGCQTEIRNAWSSLLYVFMNVTLYLYIYINLDRLSYVPLEQIYSFCWKKPNS